MRDLLMGGLFVEEFWPSLICRTVLTPPGWFWIMNHTKILIFPVLSQSTFCGWYFLFIYFWVFLLHQPSVFELEVIICGWSPSGCSGPQQNSCFHQSQSRPGPEAAPQHPHHTTGTMFDCWHVFLTDAGLFSTWCNRINTFQNPLSHKSTIFSQRSWGSSRYFLSNVRQAFLFFFVSSIFFVCFSPWNQPCVDRDLESSD